ncbi:caspase recruitment domain-containing protein 8-like isoform X2 [Phaenicophaeus curvirostris]|uniref:caspase recruitment domain-containing protein 8-like isoform X2 n=1 Tax=Phaenicophaeus curvirostris TaxID=33595 RepID=UPI0037F0E571
MAAWQPSAEGPGKFHIFVHTTSWKKLTVLVSPDQTVQELIDKLKDLDITVRLAKGKLFYRNKQLEGKKTLRHYGITPNSVLYYIQSFPDVLVQPAGSGTIESATRDLFFALRWMKVSDSSDKVSESTEAPRSSEQTHSLGAPPPMVPTQETPHWQNLGSRSQGHCWVCQEPSFPEVTPTITQVSSKNRLKYQAHLPREGIYQCSITGLAFEVKSAVTVTYWNTRWTRHLSEDEQDTLMPAGPLFHIKVQAGVVQKVFLPHFICLAECGADRPCFIAHFEYEMMTLETPTLLMPFYAVLDNPSFSLLGVLWRKMRSSFGSVPVHSLVLLFQQLSAANTTLHLYLIPNDKSVKQAIIEQETDWNSKVIPKPPPLTPLFLGCVYRVAGTNSVEITPDEHLTFCYRSPKKQQLFVEIYIKNVEEDTELSITNTRDNVRVWKTLLRSGDIRLTPQKPPPHGCHTPSGAAFVKKNKTELCSRMAQVPSIVLHLQDANVINKDEEEEVLSQDTRQRKNRVLLELLERKGPEAQEQLYQILRDKDPYLIADLEKSS